MQVRSHPHSHFRPDLPKLTLLPALPFPPSDISAPRPLAPTPHTVRRVSALFLPPVEALYPNGITTHVPDQRGAFVEIKGLDQTMEGASRPGFFRGVATVV